jgi:hypothetical protein
MSGWDFDEVGRFGSEKAADDYARRNNLSVHDYRTRPTGNGFELEVRRSAVDGDKLRDRGEGRQDGFF